MKKKQKTGLIAFIALLVIVSVCFVFSNFEFFKGMFSDFVNQLFLLFLYAVIPIIPAAVLRAKFGERAVKWIMFAATAIGLLCFLTHIFLPESILEKKVIVFWSSAGVVYERVNGWIFVFTQYALTSSVPALYCAAFAGNLYRFPFVRRSIFVILAPSLMFFLSLSVRRMTAGGFLDTFMFVFEQTILMLLLSGILYAVWALLLFFISSMIYRGIKKHAGFEKVLTKYSPIALACILIPVLAFSVFTLLKNDEKPFKTYEERSDRYVFSYKNSGLYISKKIFDEYELTDGHIKNFFDGAETVYEKLADFFPKHDFPEVVTYYAVPQIWVYDSPYVPYSYYGDKIHLGAWIEPWNNEIFCEENLFAQYLGMIDTGFPSILCREAGRVFITFIDADEPLLRYYNPPYVWDSDLFAVLSEYYIASEMPTINAEGKILTAQEKEWEDSYCKQFFNLVDKYGYKTISDTLKKVNNSSPDNDSNERNAMALFVKFLSEKTGDNIEFFK